MSQSIVGGLASPPIKRSVIKPLLWLLLVWVFFGWAFALQLDRLSINNLGRSPAPIIDGPKVQHDRKSVPAPPPALSREQSDEVLLAIALLGVGLGALCIWRLVTALRFNRAVYPQLLQHWQLSFMCRGCGAVFYPPDAHTITVVR